MLKRLELRSFKSWQEARVDFGRITGLFGVNSSGKSSLTQFLLLLKQTREATDRATTLELNGRFVQLGTATDVVHAHDGDRAIELEIEFEHGSDLRIDDPSSRKESLIRGSRSRTVRAELDIFRHAFRSRALTHSAGEARFSSKPKEGGNGGFDLAALKDPLILYVKKSL